MSELRLDKIGQIAVNAADLEVAVSFYRDILGMKFLFQVPGLAFFDCDGVRLLLDELAGWQHPSSILYYKVEDIQSAHQTLGQARCGIPRKAAPGRQNARSRISGWRSSKTLQAIHWLS